MWKDRIINGKFPPPYKQITYFSRFVTEAYITYYALRLCGMTDVQSAPVNVDRLNTSHDKATFFTQLSHRIVADVWQMPSITQINDVVEGQVDDHYVAEHWCFCNTGRSKSSNTVGSCMKSYSHIGLNARQS